MTMKRKFVLAAAIAGACFFVAGCQDDDDTAALNTGDAPMTAAETNAHCSGKCSGTCEKGDVAAAETKAKGSCCKGEAAQCTKKAN
jgi:hypothetical protein